MVAGPATPTSVRPDTDDAALQVTVSEVRPDGVEYLVQNGWLRLEHRAEDDWRPELEVVHSLHRREASEPLRPGKWVEARVDLPSIGHPFREGSQLRLTIATPGRNHATWEFEPAAAPCRPRSRSAARPSAPRRSCCRCSPGAPDAPVPPCPGLRGQACRPYEATANTAAD